MPSVSRNALGSPSIASWGSFFARALPLIALPPLVFRFLPEPDAALWFVLITLQGLQLLLESSVGQTFIRAIGFAQGGATQLGDQRMQAAESTSKSPNLPMLSSIWLSMVRLYLMVGLSTLLLVAIAGWFATETLLPSLGEPAQGTAALVIFIIGIGLRAYGGLQISYLYGIGKITLLRWWEMFFWLLSFLGASLVLINGGNLLETVVAYQTPLLINLGWNAILARKDRVLRKLPAAVHTETPQIMAQLWPPMWRAGLGVGLYLATTQGAGLVFARVGDPGQVAAYLFAMSLIRPMIQFAQVPFFTKLPLLATLQATGERTQQLLIAQRAMLLSHAILAIMIVLAAIALPELEQISQSTSAHVPPLLWWALGIAAYLERIGAMHLQLYSQTNHILWHWANGGAALLFTVFAVLLYPSQGAIAFPLAMIVSMVFFYTPYCLWHSYKYFRLSVPMFEIKTSGVPLAAIFLFGAIGVFWP